MAEESTEGVAGAASCLGGVAVGAEGDHLLGLVAAPTGAVIYVVAS
jgi:hypothetical protein